MWINRRSYERLVQVIHNLEKSIASSEGIRQTYAEQNKVLQVTLDWLRVRVNQLEHERAQLLLNYTGVKIIVPEIQKSPEPKERSSNEAFSFSGLNDEEAARQGITWDEYGNVVYKE